jgi:hypothetical protein
MTKKSFYSAIVLAVAGIILVWAYLAPAAPPEGKGYDRVLEKITFIHYKKDHAKPPWAGGGNGGGTEEQGYYTYLANGTRWRETEDYRLNPTNGDGVGKTLITNAVDAGMREWEAPEGVSFEIFGSKSIDYTVAYRNGEYRGYNTISFGAYADPGVIAVTTVWGYFSGPPSQREIIEAHILLNDLFVWGDAIADSSVMDLQNILTHELGHWAGMGDLYESAAAEETMYGYSTEGETKKRSLEVGDITGISKLY